MDEGIPDTTLLQYLEGLAAQLEIEVRYENLADDEVTIHSGGCKLQGRILILIDRQQPPAECARILAASFLAMTWKTFTSCPGEGIHSDIFPGEKPSPEIEEKPHPQEAHPSGLKNGEEISCPRIISNPPMQSRINPGEELLSVDFVGKFVHVHPSFENLHGIPPYGKGR